MKKAMGVLALLAFVGNVASAELLKNFKYDGKIEVNAYNSNNADFNKDANDKSGFTDTRVMLNAGFDLNDDVSAVVSAVKNNRQYGKASEHANNIQDNLFFEQAYLNLKGVLGLDHKLGRQYYGEAGDMVVYYGPLMWPYDSGMTVNAIDGWTGWYKYNNWDFHALIAKEKQATAPNTPGAHDINVSGFNAKTKVADVNLNGYVYQKNDNDTNAGDNDYLTVVGIRAKYELPMVKNLVLGAEYDMNMGKHTNAGLDHKGIAYKVNADYSMDLAGKLALMGEYVHQSGDDKAADDKDEAFRDINGDYRPGIIAGGGFMTGLVLGASDGLNVWNVGAKWTPSKMDKLTLSAKYFDFAADNDNTFTEEHLGNELDLCAKWQHSENVGVKAYYAMFMPEKDNVANDDAQTMMGAAFMVKF